MPRHQHWKQRISADLGFALTVFFMLVLWVAGGASRADVAGQVVTRLSAWIILIAYILTVPRNQLRVFDPVVKFVLAMIILVAIQLIPLPPSVWPHLPGHSMLVSAADIIGMPQPWRPISISPGWTENALSSLIVPGLVAVLMSGLNARENWSLETLLLGLIFASAMLGLLQFSGARFQNPLLNDIPGMVSASFANRNHFALFEAIGCILAPVWAYRSRQTSRWKRPIAAILVLIFVLLILATGSRMGILLGFTAVFLSIFNVRQQLIEDIRRLPRRLGIALVISVAALFIAVLIFSIVQGRAVSLNRVASLAASQDLRREAFPTVWNMTKQFFPVGIGFGTFDPAYRIFEANSLLGPQYFNHAHNDILEIVLEGGIVSLTLLFVALVWWFRKSVAVWRSTSSKYLLPRAGSTTILLVLIASTTDYPARTPMIMAILVIAAFWLSRHQSLDPRDVSAQSKRRV